MSATTTSSQPRLLWTPETLADRQRRVAEADTDSFTELLALSGLDRSRDLRFFDWSEADFTGCDLTGCDFTGATLTGCRFAGARIAGARFDQAQVDRAALQQAADWPAALESWSAPTQLPDGRHLPDLAVFSDAPFAPEMVVIPAGSFLMGSPPDEPGRSDTEGPQHRVTIARRFALGRYAVTQAEWWAVMGNNPSHFKGDRNPVDSVSWEDAQRFLGRLNQRLGLSPASGYRLPSEAEWEYACRAGTTTPFWWGRTITTDQANYNGNFAYAGGPKGVHRGTTVPVDEFEPNPFGLYQMHGNVWEWVEDRWHGSYNGAPEDGSAWIDASNNSRGLRGGSWGNYPRLARAAYRNYSALDYRGNRVGFRVARTIVS